MLILLRFFTFFTFFENPKKRDFLRFFCFALHVFSNYGRNHDASFFVLIQYRSVTDRQTDSQTDIPPLAIPAVCIACYPNALVKIVKIANFYPPQSHKSPSLGVTPFEFRDEPDIF